MTVVEVLFFIIGSLILLYNRRRIVAIFRWLARSPIDEPTIACGQEVWWEDCSYGDCTRYHKNISAINEQKRLFMVGKETNSRKIEDLRWCPYYGNWNYEEGREAARRKEEAEMRKARNPKDGWYECPTE